MDNAVSADELKKAKKPGDGEARIRLRSSERLDSGPGIHSDQWPDYGDLECLVC